MSALCLFLSFSLRLSILCLSLVLLLSLMLRQQAPSRALSPATQAAIDSMGGPVVPTPSPGFGGFRSEADDLMMDDDAILAQILAQSQDDR